MNRFLGIFSVALALALSFSACSSDDDVVVLDNTVWVYNDGGVTINLNFTGNNSFTLGNAAWVSGSSAAAAASAASSAAAAAAAGGGGGGAAAASSSSSSAAAAGGGGGGAAAAASSASSSGSYSRDGSTIILIVNGHQCVGQCKGNTIVFTVTYDDGSTQTYVFTRQ